MKCNILIDINRVKLKKIQFVKKNVVLYKVYCVSLMERVIKIKINLTSTPNLQS